MGGTHSLLDEHKVKCLSRHSSTSIIRVRGSATLDEVLQVCYKHGLLSVVVEDGDEDIGVVGMADACSFIVNENIRRASEGKPPADSAALLKLSTAKSVLQPTPIDFGLRLDGETPGNLWLKRQLLAQSSTSSPAPKAASKADTPIVSSERPLLGSAVVVKANDTLRSAVSAMSQAHVHRMVVFDGKRVQSIASQSALLQFAHQRLKQHDPKSQLTVKELGLGMHKRLVTCMLQDNVSSVFKMMIARGINSVAVLHSGKGDMCVGQVSFSGLRDSSLEFFHRTFSTGLTVEEYLKEVEKTSRNKTLACAYEQTPFAGLISVMVERHVHRLWVVSPQMTLLGVITAGDVLQVLLSGEAGAFTHHSQQTEDHQH